MQEEFAEKFRIPLGTLRDWDQGKSIPDQAARVSDGDIQEPEGGEGGVGRSGSGVFLTQ